MQSEKRLYGTPYNRFFSLAPRKTDIQVLSDTLLRVSDPFAFRNAANSFLQNGLVCQKCTGGDDTPAGLQHTEAFRKYLRQDIFK